MSQMTAFVPTPVSPEIACAIGVGVGLVAGTILSRLAAAPSRITSVGSSIANRPPYKPGQQPTLPSATFGKYVEIFNPSELKSSYNLMTSSVTPRPIALVSSTNKKTGVDNVAPFSYFGAVAHDPPMIAIGFCRKGREDRIQKDSLSNIISTKEFSVNIISEWYLDAANHSCGLWGSDVDEFLESGLTKGQCMEISCPRVKEAAVTYECRLEHCYPVTDDKGNPTTEVVLARVVRIHVDRDVLVENFDPGNPTVDTNKLKPVSRLGGNTYCFLGEQVDISRPSV
jgi:flavin reductase (DIM6/NTAB) family NADH-FMN oxidoreductase RutF